MILFADNEGPDQTARLRSLIWAFAVRTLKALSLDAAHYCFFFFFFFFSDIVVVFLSLNIY